VTLSSFSSSRADEVMRARARFMQRAGSHTPTANSISLNRSRLLVALWLCCFAVPSALGDAAPACTSVEQLLVQRKAVLVGKGDVPDEALAHEAAGAARRESSAEVLHDHPAFSRPPRHMLPSLLPSPSQVVRFARTWSSKVPSLVHQSGSRVAALVQIRSEDTKGLQGIELVFILFLLMVFCFTAIMVLAFCMGYGPKKRQEARPAREYGPSGGATPGRAPRTARTALLTAGAFQERSAPTPRTRGGWPQEGCSPPFPSSTASLQPGTTPRIASSLTQGVADAASQVLCPGLKVPEQKEFVLAVREMLTRERQQISFSIMRLDGNPVSHIIVNETGWQCGIHLQMLDRTPLAWVRTSRLYEQPRGVPEICLPGGQIFGTIEPEQIDSDGIVKSYKMCDSLGQTLYRVHGSFKDKVVNMMTMENALVCWTERCALPSDTRPYYKVTIGPGFDAGLVLCTLLAIDKLEGPMVADPGDGGNSPTPAAGSWGLLLGRRPGTVC